MKVSTAFIRDWTNPWREYCSEFIGSLVFVFLASSVVVSQNIVGQDNLLVIALGTGFSYACILYATGHVSGGFLNPAVVVSLWLVKKLSGVKTTFFIIAQVLGSLSGAILVFGVFGQRAVQNLFGAPQFGLGVVTESALIFEITLSAIFVFLVHAVGVNKSAPTIFGPLVYGLYLVVCTLVAYGTSGASVNVTRAFGPVVLSGQYSSLFVYIVGGLSGSLVGVFYEYVFVKKYKSSKS